MKKILLSTLLISPIIFTSVDQSLVKLNSNYSEVYVEEYSINLEEDLDTMKVISDEEITWTYDLKEYLPNGFDYTGYSIGNDTINLRYGMGFKTMNWIGKPEHETKWFWSDTGPGDNNGHTGWNEVDYPKGRFVVQEKEVIPVGYDVVISDGLMGTHYDEYHDDGHGSGDPSGFRFDDYLMTSSLGSDGILELNLEIIGGFSSDQNGVPQWENVEADGSKGSIDDISLTLYK